MPANDSRVFHRRLDVDYPVAVSASGVRITDAAGRTYIDGVSGAAVCSYGYGDPSIIAAVKAQLDRLAYVHSATFTSEASERLADRLTALDPGHWARAYFLSGGSEAVETALKMARQHAVLSGRPQASRFVSRRHSYHGGTLATLALGGSPGRRALYEPLLATGVQVSPCYAYRCRGPGESEAGYAGRLVEEARQAIERAGPETLIAFVAETVSGAELAAATAPAGYFAGLRELCDRHGLLLILDEVMCGVGRTGTMFAYEQEGVRPDLVVLAKGLGGGYQPIGAVLASRKVFEAFERDRTAFQHGHTYIGHAAACAAGSAVLEKIKREALLPRVRDAGAKFDRLLGARLGDHPHVGDIRGRGLLWGVELVRDRVAGTPFEPDLRVAARLKAEALEAGLVCYPMGGFLDGVRGDHVLLAPPFICTDADLEEIVDKLATSIDRVTLG